ncbi:GrpB family protein [Ensifer adhaerens]|uniref:GrpB family protein n=1 Tax=Ensifer adhaerens TaxID=106592 RepID=UPI0023A91405|nr:GrpB family protein [Ensifer adhaerens]WDZ78919.1 GrpB family protein [Ensifer adhaerens]
MNTTQTRSPQPVEICAWSPEWPSQFAVKAKRIRSVLGERAIRIDHVGSTAIQGLAAKPIIDIQISVADLHSIEVLKEEMSVIGYMWRPLNGDLTKRYFREAPGNERTHIHVRALGSWSEQWSLLFRDYMRGHGEEHAPYAELKRALASRYQDDRVAYTEAKSEHLWGIVRRADSWAARTGWQPGPSDA